jgi:hypothetical protein
MVSAAASRPGLLRRLRVAFPCPAVIQLCIFRQRQLQQYTGKRNTHTLFHLLKATILSIFSSSRFCDKR